MRDRGAIAQLGERLDRTQEVGGSSPPSSIEKPLLSRGFLMFKLLPQRRSSTAGLPSHPAEALDLAP